MSVQPLPQPADEAIKRAWKASKLTHMEVFLRYQQRGGEMSFYTVGDYLRGDSIPDILNYDILALVLNEELPKREQMTRLFLAAPRDDGATTEKTRLGSVTSKDAKGQRLSVPSDPILANVSGF